MHALEHVGIDGNSGHERVEPLAEFLAETVAPRLVPRLHFQRIVNGLGPKDELPRCHLCPQLCLHDCPRNGGARIGEVFSPSTVEFGALICRQFKIRFALALGQALPECHRERGPISGWQLKQFAERIRRHAR
jgi:hypothetical protein